MSKIEIAPASDAFRPSRVFRAGRDMPEGSIGWHVDCADDPLDLRPAVETILCAIDERRAALPEDRILVVPVGEIHPCPSYSALFTLLVKEMKARGDNFIVSLEAPHDEWKDAAEAACIPPETLKGLSVQDIDPDGRLSLLTALGFSSYTEASVSRNSNLHFLLDNNIKTIFSDASKKFGLSLNYDDPATAAAIKRYMSGSTSIEDKLLSTIKVVGTQTRLGMAARNDVTKMLTLEFARTNMASIALVYCGLGHIFSDFRPSRQDYGHSQYTLFGQEAAVLPACITNKYLKIGVNILEERAYPSLRNSVVVDGTAESFFTNEDQGSYERGGILRGRKEQDFLHEIHEATEGAYPVPADIDKESYKDQAIECLKTRLANYSGEKSQPEPS